jgi:hypothetical protein
VLHEEFADRVAECFEARAGVLEHGNRSAGSGVPTTRASKLRNAAAMARWESVAVTQEEAPPLEAQA